MKIQDLPLLPEINGTEKIPTGGFGVYAVSIDQLTNHVVGDLVDDLALKADQSTVDDLVATVASNLVTQAEKDASQDQAISAVGGGAKSYLTLASLNAVVSPIINTLAYVSNDSTSSNNGMYTYNGVAWVKSLYDPLAQALSALALESTRLDAVDASLLSQINTIFTANGLNVLFNNYDQKTGVKYLFSVVAKTTMQVVFGVKANGSIVNNFGSFDRSTGNFSSLITDANAAGIKYQDGKLSIGLFDINLNSDCFMITDQNGRTALRISRTGEVFVAGVTTSVTPQTNAVLGLQALTDYVHIVVYGQSLSRSTDQASPPLSVSPTGYTSMLAAGVNVRVNDVGYDKTAFAPMVESVLETPVSGVCNGLANRIVKSDGTFTKQILGSTTGNGGKTVEQLSVGGEGFFENTVQYIKDCKSLADSQSKTYSVYAHVWVQGEANYNGTTGADYISKYRKLNQDMSDSIVSITNQKFLPYFVHYQVAAHRRSFSSTMQIAIAQWRSSRMFENTILAVPAYAMKHGADYLHLTATGAWLMGQYMARAIHWTMHARNGKWRPLEPTSVNWTDTYIDVKYHVPCKPIVIDTFFANMATNAGFDIYESGNYVSSLITSVTVTSEDTLRLTLSRPTALDAVLACGRGRSNSATQGGNNSAVVTNVRDSHGIYDVVTSPDSTTYALHNPSVMFEYSRETGF